MQTLDLFELGDTATWEIEVELRDRECNRNDFIIPMNEELLDGPYITRIDYHLIDTPYKLKSACYPHKI
tara:strand:- start:59 stop:265 length:207 start_codon:yes stop_codon:yes gene_type:complete